MSSFARTGVLTTGQVAWICAVSPRTIQKWIDTGHLPGWKIPGVGVGRRGGGDRRVEAIELAAFLEAHAMPDAIVRFKALFPGSLPGRPQFLCASPSAPPPRPNILKRRVEARRARREPERPAYKVFEDEDSGYVYFVQPLAGGDIKIGFSLHPVTRIVRLQGSSPVRLRCLGVTLGGRRREHEVHTRFHELRVRGEWFKPDETLMAYITEHCIPFEPPPTPLPPSPRNERTRRVGV